MNTTSGESDYPGNGGRASFGGLLLWPIVVLQRLAWLFGFRAFPPLPVLPEIPDGQGIFSAPRKSAPATASPALPPPSWRVAQWIVWWINRAKAEYDEWEQQPAPKPPAPVGPMASTSDRVATLAYRDALVAMGVTPAA